MNPVRSCFLILFLKEFRVCKSLILLLSFDHKNGPKYLTECFPWRTVLKHGISKSLFLSKYLLSLILNRSETFPGTSPYLTLYINIIISYGRLLYRVGNFARSKSSSYMSELDSYTAEFVPVYAPAFYYPLIYKNATPDSNKLGEAG